MAFNWNRFAYTNFHELNLDWFNEHFKEIFEEWEDLYNTLTEWKANTDRDLAEWKHDTLETMDLWERELLAALDEWKTDTGNDISEWEAGVISDLNDWKETFLGAYEALEDRVDAIVSDTEDMVDNLAEPFSTSKNYSSGDYVVYNGVLYRFAADHAAGAWTGTDAGQTSAMHDITGLQNNFNKETKALGLNFNLLTGWQNGFWSNADGTYNPARLDYVCTKKPISVKPGDVLKIDNIPYATGAGALYFVRYDASMHFISGSVPVAVTSPLFEASYTIPSGVYYVNLDFTRGNINTVENISDYNKTRAFVSPYDNGISDIFIRSPLFRNGAVANPDNVYAISMMDIEKCNNAKAIKIKCSAALDTGERFQYRISTFPVNSGQSYAMSQAYQRIRSDVISETIDDRRTGYFDFNENEIGYAVSVLKIDSNNSFVPLRDGDIKDGEFSIIYIYDSDKYTTNYIITPLNVKTPIKLSASMGKLKYLQAFCKYNDKYYSIDGSNIAEQDESFTTLRDTSLNTGHGNSLQIGNSSIAYASGWNDNKIYAVDLSTLTIDSVISLPTTGYTTAAIDEVNKLAYILQRDSYPETEDYYNFIIYDYDNQSVISTKKITKKFGAMQACDFINGYICIAYGMGSAEVPSGIMVLNSVGDICAEYIIPALYINELEGIYFDKEKGQLLVSVYNKNVYRII